MFAHRASSSGCSLSTRLFSTSAVRSAKKSSIATQADVRARQILKDGNPGAMPIADAAQVLRAIEVGSPKAAYELTILTHHVRGQAPPRGRISLPRDPRLKADTILVFAEGKQASAARKFGAHHVGGAELIDDVLSEKIVPTKVLCTPALLPVITPKLARFLGPKGLMPALRRGTVTEDITSAVKASAGTLDWKGDKQGVIRVPIARMEYTIDELEANVKAFLGAMRDAQAAKIAASLTQKKTSNIPQILRVHLSSRQGPGVPLLNV